MRTILNYIKGQILRYLKYLKREYIDNEIHKEFIRGLRFLLDSTILLSVFLFISFFILWPIKYFTGIDFWTIIVLSIALGLFIGIILLIRSEWRGDI